MVSEFVAQQGRLPNGDIDVERTAHHYVDSALGRRWSTSPSGEQLSLHQLDRWEELFQLLQVVCKPVWKEDPVFLTKRNAVTIR